MTDGYIQICCSPSQSSLSGDPDFWNRLESFRGEAPQNGGPAWAALPEAKQIYPLANVASNSLFCVHFFSNLVHFDLVGRLRLLEPLGKATIN